MPAATLNLISTTTLKTEAYMGLSGASNDTILTALIGSASAAIESFCGRSFKLADYTEVLNRWENQTFVQLRAFPVLLQITIGAITGGPFVAGETITGTTSGAIGVVGQDTATGVTTLYFTATSGTFVTAETITGTTSEATATSGSAVSVAVSSIKTAQDWDFDAVDAVDTDNYDVELATGIIRFAHGVLETGPRSLQIVYHGGLSENTAGIESGHPVLSTACFMIVDHLFRRRHELDEVTESIASMGATTRKAVRIPEIVKQILLPYRTAEALC